jgi:hypothetical protein
MPAGSSIPLSGVGSKNTKVGIGTSGEVVIAGEETGVEGGTTTTTLGEETKEKGGGDGEA